MAIDTNNYLTDPYSFQALVENEDISNEIFKWLPATGNGAVGTLEKCSNQMKQCCYRFYANPAQNFLREITFVWSECVDRPDAIKWNKVLGFLTAKMLERPNFEFPDLIMEPKYEKVKAMFPLWTLAMKSLRQEPNPRDIFEFGKNYKFKPYSGNLFIEGLWDFKCGGTKDSFFEKIKKAAEQGYTYGIVPFNLYALSPFSFEQKFELTLISAEKNVFDGWLYLESSLPPHYMPQLLRIIYWKIEKLYIYESDSWLEPHYEKGLKSDLKKVVSFFDKISKKFESMDAESKELFLICESLLQHFLKNESKNLLANSIETSDLRLIARDKKTAESNRWHAGVLLARAEEKFATDDFKGAYECVVKSMKLFVDKIPVKAIAYEARCLYQMGAYQRAYYRCEAIRDFYELNKKEDKSQFPGEFLRMMGDCQFNLQNYEEACSHYQQCRSNGDNSVYPNMGFCLYQKGDYREAYELYELCKMHHKKDIPSELLLAALDCSQRCGTFERWSKYYERFLSEGGVIDIAQCSVGTLRYMGDYEHATGRYAEAFKLYLRVSEETHTKDDLIEQMGFCMMKLGDFKAADELYRRFFETTPEIGHEHCLGPAAFCKFQLKDLEEAQKLFAKSIFSQAYQLGQFCQVFNGINHQDFIECLSLIAMYTNATDRAIISVPAIISCLHGKHFHAVTFFRFAIFYGADLDAQAEEMFELSKSALGLT